jgi:hypothetical protein
MGTVPVMLIDPAGESTDDMRCSFLARNELKGSSKTAFVDEAARLFRKQMKGKSTSKKRGHSRDAVRRFSAAMQEALDRVPEAERWEIGKISHEDMARAALVAYDFMIHLLPKFGQHPKRDDKLYLEMHGDVGAKSVSAIVDSGANGVLISVPTAKRKGLLNRIDVSQKVTLSQADQKKKMETYGAVKGGVSYQMISRHGRTVTITLPCHVAPVDNDLVGSNEQGPLLKGIGGVVYIEYAWPDGRRATCMQMPDGKVVGLPADSKGLTVLPEIGQESQWSVQSHLMDIADLCDFLMSREHGR